MAKQANKTDPEEYTVTLRGCSERWTVNAVSEASAIESIKKQHGLKRDARNFRAIPTRLINPAAPSIKVPVPEQPQP